MMVGSQSACPWFTYLSKHVGCLRGRTIIRLDADVSNQHRPKNNPCLQRDVMSDIGILEPANLGEISEPEYLGSKVTNVYSISDSPL